MAIVTAHILSLFCLILNCTDLSAKMNEDDILDSNPVVLRGHKSNPRPSDYAKKLDEVWSKKIQELAGGQPITADTVDRVIPDRQKVVFTIELSKPMRSDEAMKTLIRTVADALGIKEEHIKVTMYEPFGGLVKMLFLEEIPGENRPITLGVASSHEMLNILRAKRLQNAGSNIKILDLRHGSDINNIPLNSGQSRRVNIERIFNANNWEVWQLAVLIAVTLFSIFCIIIVIFVSSQRAWKDKVTPVDEPQRVIVQPILRPAVAGIGGVQPGHWEGPRGAVAVPDRVEAAAVVENVVRLESMVRLENSEPLSDPEPMSSPSRSPMRRNRGLLERRGSNASLTLDLNRSQENISCGTPPKECSGEEYLMSTNKRMSRRKLRLSLKDVKALYSEFWEIPMNHPEKVEVAGCGTKNRYKTILPNETSRVHLYHKSGDPLSSYINANYIRGFDGQKNTYIATQGPLPHTVNDFWMMVWKEKSPIIVMITKLKENLKVKCEPYIPDYQDRYDEVEVTVTRVRPCDGYTMRDLLLRKGNETLCVKHFWYTTWPDHKTPDTAKQLLMMAMEVEKFRCQNRPVVVHCSAGIGRTGCFIATCIGIQQLLIENSVDVLGIVCALRLDRGGMVQTAEQYEFVHQALNIFSESLNKGTARVQVEEHPGD